MHQIQNLPAHVGFAYDANPPFYEGVALDAPISYSDSPSPAQCLWDTPRKRITLALITGREVCVGN